MFLILLLLLLPVLLLLILLLELLKLLLTAVSITPKAKKGKFSGSLEGKGELNHNTLSKCGLSKGCVNDILGIVLCMKLKLTGFVVRHRNTLNSIQYPSSLLSSQEGRTSCRSLGRGIRVSRLLL